MNILEKVEKEQTRHGLSFRAGDQVRVHVKIVEGDKERIQVFEGVVIALHRGGNRASFTVRKVSYGVGVERIFPVHSPSVDKVEVVSSGRVRRGRLYYLRDRAGKAARLKEREGTVAETAAAAPAAMADAAAVSPPIAEA
ncbi:MAG: 50S ribosomal protein L19 [Deltaproteobacteria bacterium]|nr:50S ribosomal protein L19 [Deltaproteobacteria bacterium]